MHVDSGAFGVDVRQDLHHWATSDEESLALSFRDVNFQTTILERRGSIRVYGDQFPALKSSLASGMTLCQVEKILRFWDAHIVTGGSK